MENIPESLMSSSLSLENPRSSSSSSLSPVIDHFPLGSRFSSWKSRMQKQSKENNKHTPSFSPSPLRPANRARGRALGIIRCSTLNNIGPRRSLLLANGIHFRLIKSLEIDAVSNGSFCVCVCTRIRRSRLSFGQIFAQDLMTQQ